MPLTVAPEWLPIDLSKCTVASEALHGLLSGIIHLHVYALSSELGNADVPALHGPAHPSTSTLEASLGLRIELAIDTVLLLMKADLLSRLSVCRQGLIQPSRHCMTATEQEIKARRVQTLGHLLKPICMPSKAFLTHSAKPHRRM